ncbi:MAG: hypothetical protein ABEK16_03000 [Candidatus Nanohalobium sp.]
MTLKELQERILPEKANEKLEGFERSHFFDQREFGKVLVIVSITMFVFSVHGLNQINQTAQKVDKLESDMEQLSAVISSEAFNSTLQAIESLQTTDLGEQFDYAAQTFRAMQDRVAMFEDINSDLENLQTTYQWLTLISILMMAAGVTVIFI